MKLTKILPLLLVFVSGLISGSILTLMLGEEEPASLNNKQSGPDPADISEEKSSRGYEHSQPALKPDNPRKAIAPKEDGEIPLDSHEGKEIDKSGTQESTTPEEPSKLRETVQYVMDPKSLPDKELLTLIERTRKAIDERFLVPSTEILQTWSHFAEQADSGVNRILERGPFEGLTSARGGGAYFSFVSRKNDYNSAPDIELQQGRFSSGFAGGDFGIVIKLEKRTIETVSIADVPDYLLEEDANILYRRKRSHRSPQAEFDETYLVRSVQWRACDTLAAFQVVQDDEYGVTFVWKILKRFSRPQRTR
jgi:hypothetical protein